MSPTTYPKPTVSHTNTGKGGVDHQSEYSGKMVTQAGECCATQCSSNSDSEPGTPPTSPTPEYSQDKYIEPEEADVPYEKERYVRLKAAYMKHLDWSNDPQDLDLYGAFREDEPNLSSDFCVEGLRPIVKDRHSDLYLLTDAAENYYLWDPWDGHLLKVSEEYATEKDLGDYTIEGLDGIEKIVENIIINLTWALEDAKKVFRTYI